MYARPPTLLRPLLLAGLLTVAGPLAAQSAATDAATAATAATATTAATAAPLSLPGVLARVLRDNPEIQALRQDVDAAGALRTQAALIPNPSLSVERQRVPGGLQATGTSLSIPLELGGQRGARIAAAEGGIAAARTELAQREAELRAATLQAYFDLIGAQDRSTLAQGSRDLASRATDVTARRVQAGRASPVEEARARVAEASAGIELSQAATELTNARTRLASLWGGGDPTDFVAEAPEERVPVAPEPAEIEQRVAEAPVLTRARAEIERREALVRLARAEATPATAVQVGTGTLVENGQRVNSIGLSVILPIFDRNQGQIAEARIRVDQARQAYRAAELGLRAALAQARTRLAAARAEKDLARLTILPEAGRALDATTRGYELGKFSFLEVLDAQRTLFAARAQSLRALAEAYQAVAEIERLLGPTPSSAQDGAVSVRRPDPGSPSSAPLVDPGAPASALPQSVPPPALPR